MRANLRCIKKFRKCAENVMNQVKSNLLSEVKYILKFGHTSLKEQQNKLMNEFLTLCATNIQKWWRGQKFRKN